MRTVYILLCADNTFYTGITLDVQRRLMEHNEAPIGAKYTKSRRPVSLLRTQEIEGRGNATLLERKVKKLNRKQKEKLIENDGAVEL